MIFQWMCIKIKVQERNSRTNDMNIIIKTLNTHYQIAYPEGYRHLCSSGSQPNSPSLSSIWK